MAARTTAGRVRRERLARDRWFHPGRYLTPPSSAVAREFFPEETQHPKRVSRDAIRAPRPPTTLECGESVRRERARVLPFHFFLSLFVPSLDTTSPRILISGSRSRAWMTKWNRSEMERPPVCHSHSCVTSRFSWLPKSRSRTMIPGDETRRCRWLSWLKPFWLSCGHNYTKRTEYSFSLNDLAAVGRILGINCLYYWHSILLYYHSTLIYPSVYSHNLISVMASDHRFSNYGC